MTDRIDTMQNGYVIILYYDDSKQEIVGNITKKYSGYLREKNNGNHLNTQQNSVNL